MYNNNGKVGWLVVLTFYQVVIHLQGGWLRDVLITSLFLVFLNHT